MFRYVQLWGMETFKDFCSWAGGQAKAARLIRITKARAHRLYHGAPLRPDEALAIERATNGAFRKERLIFGGLANGSGS